jgi:hypothetical protein
VAHGALSGEELALASPGVFGRCFSGAGGGDFRVSRAFGLCGSALVAGSGRTGWLAAVRSGTERYLGQSGPEVGALARVLVGRRVVVRSWSYEMSRSSTGGLGPAGGVGLEGQILAWLAAHSLGQEQLPEASVPLDWLLPLTGRRPHERLMMSQPSPRSAVIFWSSPRRD